MKIKEATGAAKDLEVLDALRQRRDLDASTRAQVELQIRTTRAGDKGEREAAYEIDFHHGHSRNWAVIHDLRIEHDGLVAQIDHLLIGRFLDFWVCETKHFSQGVSINEHGEFTSFYGNKPRAIASPLEQNRKHVRLLERILKSDKITLPTRLGMKLTPRLHSVILISKAARITRPKTNIDGLDSIVKSDQLRSHIERAIDGESAATVFTTVGKLLSSEALEEFARQVARLHRPIRRDWAAQFGLPAASADTAALPAASPPPPQPRREATDSRTASLKMTQAPTPQPDLVPTSKLGAAMGLANVAVTLERLRAAGLLEQVDGSDRLTDRGKEVGGGFVEKSRFGPYFVWPKTLRC